MIFGDFLSSQEDLNDGKIAQSAQTLHISNGNPSTPGCLASTVGSGNEDDVVSFVNCLLTPLVCLLQISDDVLSTVSSDSEAGLYFVDLIDDLG